PRSWRNNPAGLGFMATAFNRLMSMGQTIDAFPLSPMQHGMLFHHLQDPRSGIDIEQLVVHLAERVDAERLNAAWQWLVQRHDILRTRFVWAELEQPQQEVLSTAPVPFTIEDARQLTPHNQREKLKTFLKTDRLRGFDMNCAPMARLTLFQREDSASTLVWTFHHALLDGCCFPSLLQEVFEVYSELEKGGVAPRPAAPPYRRYIEWLQRNDGAGAEAFWTAFLQGF